jgi:GTP cyclohydrolase I
MEDVQNQTDKRQLAIDRVGVSDLRYPIVVLDREHQKQ